MPPKTPESIVRRYLAECARLIRGGHATHEQSHYPALNALLQELGELGNPRRTTVPNPAAIEGDLPDVAIFETISGVLVLAVEAKSARVGLEQILASDQAHRYARTFGGGRVLVTNLRGFAWGELGDDERLAERGRLELLGDEADLVRARPTPEVGTPERLVEMLDAACTTRALLQSPARVARLLAYHAREMVEAIERHEDPEELLRALGDSMRDGLGMHLEESFFVPTVVQTLVYGLFAAWLESPDPQQFDWRGAEYALKVPVIASIFHQTLDPAFIEQCDLQNRLGAVARVLQWVDRDDFTNAFDRGAIEYFYEPFLAAFDPDLRDRLGVWYTPREIAEYQVARVDHHLREDLGIEAGLSADEVLVLDPACGTGTYLAAVLRRICRQHLANGEPPNIAASRTLRAAYSRVIGFDVLPAALVIAHLNLSRVLEELGARLDPATRLRVYLTNSLSGWGAGAGVPALPLPGLEDELREALEVKAHEPVLAVLGNPPYHGYSAADTEEERELLRVWIDPLWPKYGLRKHRLGDLYVRFWRIAIRKIADLTGRGVVSFISNRKWLGGRSFPAMRETVIHDFHEIVVDDLHGDVHDRSHPDDGSVFTTRIATGIQVGVAIVTTVRLGATDEDRVAHVRGRDFWGSGEDKREKLLDRAEEGIDEDLEERQVAEANRWRLVVDTGGDDPPLDEYLEFFRSGVQPVRDEAVVDTDHATLERRMRDYFDDRIDLRALLRRYPGFGVIRRRYDPGRTRERLLADSGFAPERIVRYLYRPFDVRWLYWEPDYKLLNEARRELMPYYLEVPDQRAIVVPQTPRRQGAARPLVSTAVPRFEAVDPNSRVFPRVGLQLPTARNDENQLTLGDDFAVAVATQVSNVRPEWITSARSLGIEGTDLEVGDAIFYALISIMNSPTWVDSIPTDSDDFAGVPLPSDLTAFRVASDLGRQLADLADPDVDVSGVTSGRIDYRWVDIAVPEETGTRRLVFASHYRGGVWEPDEHGTGIIRWGPGGGWRNVPYEVWEFSAGGFPVIAKWLSYRRGRDLTDDEVETVTLLCRRIAAIRALEPECNRLFELARLAPLVTVTEVVA